MSQDSCHLIFGWFLTLFGLLAWMTGSGEYVVFFSLLVHRLRKRAIWENRMEGWGIVCDQGRRRRMLIIPWKITLRVSSLAGRSYRSKPMWRHLGRAQLMGRGFEWEALLPDEAMRPPLKHLRSRRDGLVHSQHRALALAMIMSEMEDPTTSSTNSQTHTNSTSFLSCHPSTNFCCIVNKILYCKLFIGYILLVKFK